MAPAADEQKDGSVKSKNEKQASIGVLDGLRIIVGLLVLNCLASYMIMGNLTWGQKPWWIRPNALIAKLRGPMVFTDAELLNYAGQDESLPIYLALNGTVYDVTAGRRIYGPGGPYNVFAGRDAARAYVTGCFKEDNVPDYRGVEWTYIPTDVPGFFDTPDEALPEQKRFYRYEEMEKADKEVKGAIAHWAKVFRGETGKDYLEVGYVQREPGWMEKLPIRPLCSSAVKKRPKPRFDEEKQYRTPENRKAAKAWRAKKKQMEDINVAVPKPKAEGKGHDEI